MVNTVLGLLFVALAVAALIWRTMGDARAVADNEEPDAAGPAGDGVAGSDYSGIAAGAEGGAVGGGGGSAGPS